MWLECAIETFPSESTTASIELLAMTEMSHVFCVRFITYDTPEKQMGSNKFKVASIVMFFFWQHTCTEVVYNHCFAHFVREAAELSIVIKGDLQKNMIKTVSTLVS